MASVIHISRQLIECDAHNSQTIQAQILVNERLWFHSSKMAELGKAYDKAGLTVFIFHNLLLIYNLKSQCQTYTTP